MTVRSVVETVQFDRYGPSALEFVHYEKVADFEIVISVPLLNMTQAAPSFLCDNKLNTTERSAADVMFKRGTEIILSWHVHFHRPVSQNMNLTPK